MAETYSRHIVTLDTNGNEVLMWYKILTDFEFPILCKNGNIIPIKNGPVLKKQLCNLLLCLFYTVQSY